MFDGIFPFRQMGATSKPKREEGWFRLCGEAHTYVTVTGKQVRNLSLQHGYQTIHEGGFKDTYSSSGKYPPHRL